MAGRVTPMATADKVHFEKIVLENFVTDFILSSTFALMFYLGFDVLLDDWLFLYEW